MKSGSASIERHAETQAPHWMQAIVCVMSTIDSGGTMRSRSGGSPSSSSHGVTRRIFSQCVDSMSVTRSLITGMFPIGSTTIGSWRRWHRFAASCASPIWVRQASVDWPLILTPHEPQIAARHEQRTDERAVVAVLGLQQAVEHRERRVELDLELLPVGALARLGLEAPDLERVLLGVGLPSCRARCSLPISRSSPSAAIR